MFLDFLLAFIPIFVAVDAIGILPVFISLTEGLNHDEKNKIINQSLWTAFILAFGFILLGKMVFILLGITVGDFMVAGGAILFCISIIDLLFPGQQRRIPAEDMGAVPIGTPLIVGPAVLTTSLLLIDQYGLLPTIVSVLSNILLVGIVIRFSNKLMKFISPAGSRAISKVMALLLAAIAVKMVRNGLFAIIAGNGG